MRDENRIDEVFIALSKIWHRTPDWRFGQLLINYGIVEDSFRLWNADDDDLLKGLKKLVKEGMK